MCQVWQTTEPITHPSAGRTWIMIKCSVATWKTYFVIQLMHGRGSNTTHITAWGKWIEKMSIKLRLQWGVNCDKQNSTFNPALDLHLKTYMHTLPHPLRVLTNLAGGAPSSICAGTAPPCEGHGGTCRPTERGVWPAERPVSPGTRLPPAPLAGTPLHQPHTAPSPGTTPCTGAQLSTRDELPHSQSGRKGRGGR